MLKLTRLNSQEVAINPDHISWVDSNPDTTLWLIGGEKIIVRESVDELIERVIEFRRLIGRGESPGPIGDVPRFGGPTPQRRPSGYPRASSSAPRTSSSSALVGRSWPPREG